jgi:hypothetical protein
MDDSHVTKTNEDQAMGQIAYVLIYEKIKDEVLNKEQE